MKVEKINNNKAVIILSSTELKKKRISLTDLKEGSKNAQNFFFEILGETNIIDDFESENSQLFIEVCISQDDTFMITVTKADCLPDMDKFKAIENHKTCYTVSSDLYSFSSIYNLYSFCKKAEEEHLYLGCNSLYKLNNIYYLIFSRSTIKKSEFVKTFSVISEYVEKYFSKQTTTFLEYAKPVILKNAIQTLQKF